MLDLYKGCSLPSNLAFSIEQPEVKRGSAVSGNRSFIFPGTPPIHILSSSKLVTANYIILYHLVFLGIPTL